MSAEPIPIGPSPDSGTDPGPESPPRRVILRGFRAACTVLTRIPVGGFPYHPLAWQWAPAWFPVVGLLVAAVQALALLLFAPAGAWVAACVALICGLLLTGGLHEDGLADTTDALGGGSDRDRVLAILKDSRIGVFGAIAIGMSLLLRVGLLARLGAAAPFVLVIAEVWSRLAPVWLMGTLPYVTPATVARSRPVMDTGVAQMAAATLTGLVIVAVVGFVAGPGVLVVAGLAPIVALATTLSCGWRFSVRAGGITGDFLGAAQQGTLIAVLLTAALLGP